MAEIFLGKFHGTDGFAKVVCIKRILPHYATDDSFIEMFRDEAHIGKRLQHANIVQVFDFEKVDGSYALIMEFVNGADLRTTLAACERNKMRMPLGCAIYAVAMAARGLQYAHTRKDDITGLPLGIVHRDISPQNILLSYQGEVKVTDFGIADAQSKITDTKPGVVKGKFAYMSPEQIAGKTPDARTDVFALGVVLWEMLAMRRLFHGNTDVETIKNVQAVRIQHDIRKINPSVPADVLAVLFKALEKDPRRRYASAQEFEKGLLSSLYKTQPDFTSADLAKFVSELLADRKKVSLQEIKNIMTASLRIEQKGKAVPRVVESLHTDNANIQHEKEIEIELTGLTGQPNEVVRPVKRAVGQSTASPVQVKIPNGSYAPANAPHAAPALNFQVKSKKAQAALAGFKANQKGSGWFKKVVLGMVALAILGCAAWAYQTFFTYTENTIVISSSTSPVRIYVNGSPHQNADYLTSPIKLELNAGKNRVEIQRDGYTPAVIERKAPMAESDQSVQVNLELNRSIVRANAEINAAPGMLNPWVSINRGFIYQALPLKTSQLRLGTTYNITVFPQYPRTNNAFACAFKPTSNNPAAPSQLIVSRNGGRPSCRLAAP